MPKLNKNEDGTISVLYQTRLKQHRLEEHIDAESFTLENNFHGDLNELVPRCFSSHYGIEVVLFQPTGRTSNLRLYSKYKEFGLIPDPIAQIRLNGDFPEIPRDYPNVSQWTYRTDRDYCSPFLHHVANFRNLPPIGTVQF